MTNRKESVTFKPWSGRSYAEGIEGKKVLVLGESHYHSCDDDPACRDLRDLEQNLRHAGLTKEVVDWWRDKPHRSPVSHRVPALFGLNKTEFWDRVAFYNYLQTFAGPAARFRPSEEQWSDIENARAFQQILDEFEPDRILVLGKKLWVNLPNQTPPLAATPLPELELKVSNDVRNYAELDQFCYWYKSHSGRAVLAMPVMHPSAIRFVSESWIQPVQEWLSLAAKLKSNHFQGDLP